MLRVTTIHASTASATAAYYTRYLTQAPGELPGVWTGSQAASLGLSGVVDTGQLEALLTGRDPVSGVLLGMPLADRTLADGRVVRAVAGFDATVSAPKSLSVWWALTGDERIAQAHDTAVAAVVDYLERFGATTRIRSNGGRLHPDTGGLTVASFRQTTSRLDDPQLHTHLVISAKVRTDDGRWFALDARMLKRHQRTIGGLYQSVLRAEVASRFGVRFEEIVNGQAEIAGIPTGLLEVFSKRTAQVDVAMRSKLAEFFGREGRDPSRFERAALEREAAADTRQHKTGQGVSDLRARWQMEAAEIGVTPRSLTNAIHQAAREVQPVRDRVTVEEIITGLSSTRSSWHRMDVLRAICDRLQPVDGMDATRWVQLLDRGVDRVLEACIDLDPTDDDGRRRGSDGRSVWLEPTADHVTSPLVLAQEAAILDWATAAEQEPQRPSTTVRTGGLDDGQTEAAAASAGLDRLVVIVGPAGAGKTTMLRAAVADLEGHGRPVFGVAPTAKAARVLQRETGASADTLAKLLHEWARTDRPPGDEWRLGAGCTVIVDEAGMTSTPDLHRLIQLADQQRWRLVLVGDPHQLQAVGRGGMFAELCRGDRTVQLEQIHRFMNRWEAAASLRLRHGDPRALDSYEVHGRIIPGTLDEHLDTIAGAWLDRHARGETLAITTTTNEHVERINQLIQQHRYDTGQLAPDRAAPIADGGVAYVGDVVVTRRNQRDLRTSTGEPVRNRERWTVTGIGENRELTVSQEHGHGTVTLPADYVRDYVRLGYAATEPGNQSDTQDASITLATPATTCRGLYVAMTRGRNDNLALVVTDTHHSADARDVLERILASDRADNPATTQQRTLHQQQPRERRVRRASEPDWFIPALRSAIEELGAAENALVRAHHDRGGLVDAFDTAKGDFDAAMASCAPFDMAIDRAQARLTRAGQDHLRAKERVASSGWRQRRLARTELTVAEQHLNTARVTLDHAETASVGPNDTRAVALERLQTARADLDRHDLHTRWAHLPERVEQARDIVDALYTWRTWADGHDVTADAVRHAQHIVDQLDPTIQRSSPQAHAYDRTTETGHGIELEL